MKRIVLVLLLVVAPAHAGRNIAPDVMLAQTSQPPAQEGFVPVEQLPNQEQLPAAPLVAAAYGVAWAAVLVYVWFLWRRLARVERELADVARRMESGARR
jgi:CcmD family protein